MAKTGRPITKTGEKAKRHREAARKWYQKQSTAKKEALVSNRSKEAQRKADAKRHAKHKEERNEYHASQMKAAKGKKNPGKCSVCGSTKNVEFHHQGTDRWLCGKCHAKVRDGRLK